MSDDNKHEVVIKVETPLIKKETISKIAKLVYL